MEIDETLKEIAKGLRILSKAIRYYQKIKEKKELAKVEKFVSTLKRDLANIQDPYLKDLGERFCQEIEISVEREKESRRERFGQELAGLLEKEGKKVRGQYPDLKIGLLTLEVNFEAGFANLYWGNKLEAIKRKIPLNPFLIVKFISEFQKDLSRLKFDPKTFAFQLFTAYQLLLTRVQRPFGERVFLVDLLPEITFSLQGKEFREDPKRRNFKEYPRYRFSYDLYQLQKSGLKGIEGYLFHLSVATFDQTLEKRKALWVPSNEEGEGTYYSYITFKKPNLTSGKEISPNE